MKHKKEIQVLYIITKLELGGAQKVCLSLFEGLKNNQHESYLISGQEGPLRKQVENSSYVFLIEEFKRDISIKNIWREIKTFFSIVRTIRNLKKENPYLIVHTHSTKAGIVGRWAAFCAGVKKRIHTIHGYAFHNHQHKLAWFCIYIIELMTSFITTHYICVSCEDVKTGIKLFPRFSKKHSIIRAAVDWNQFFIPSYEATPFPDMKKPFIFGTVACFKKQKNLFDLINAFELAYHENQNIRLEIIGDGELRSKIEAYIQEKSLHKKIILLGWQEQVAPIMSQWNTFILSSLWEGLPCAIVEARLLKLPVLCYKTGGIHEIIINGKNGFLYKQGNWKELANGMLAICQNKYLYKKLQEYKEDLSDFNNQQMIKQHINLYKEL